MNARQKAKKYKKIAERYKDKAEAWDRYARSEALSNYMRGYGTIETLKVVKFWDDRMPEEYLKEEISKAFAECLLREGYIHFKVDDDYNEYNMMRKVVGTIKVAKVGDYE